MPAKKKKKATGTARKRAVVETIASKDLATLTGLTDRRHRQLADEGFIPAPVRGRWKKEATISGLFRYFREKKVGAAAVDEERIRKVRAEADRVEMENELTRGRVVDVKDVLAMIRDRAVSIRDVIMNSPTLLPDEKDQILNELHRIPNAISNGS